MDRLDIFGRRRTRRGSRAASRKLEVRRERRQEQRADEKIVRNVGHTDIRSGAPKRQLSWAKHLWRDRALPAGSCNSPRWNRSRTTGRSNDGHIIGRLVIIRHFGRVGDVVIVQFAPAGRSRVLAVLSAVPAQASAFLAADRRRFGARGTQVVRNPTALRNCGARASIRNHR